MYGKLKIVSYDTGKGFIIMISEEQLAKEFTQVLDRIYPRVGRQLHRCYVKVVEFYVKRLGRRLHYIVIYSPAYLCPALQVQRGILREVAENMGLMDVVIVNATQLLRDPMSKVKQEDSRFWLELHWIATQED